MNQILFSFYSTFCRAVGRLYLGAPVVLRGCFESCGEDPFNRLCHLLLATCIDRLNIAAIERDREQLCKFPMLGCTGWTGTLKQLVIGNDA